MSRMNDQQRQDNSIYEQAGKSQESIWHIEVNKNNTAKEILENTDIIVK